ncbi:hypothetical protein Q5752_000940 [Cryptotrichosporon argae]
MDVLASIITYRISGPAAPTFDPAIFAPAVGRAQPRPKAAYDAPPADGSCRLLDMPEEVLVRVFSELDSEDFARCFRLCRALHDLLASSSLLNLQQTLALNHLLLNPRALLPPADPALAPPSSAALLSALRERLTRARNLAPRAARVVRFSEPDGRLYEYLEGVLLRGVEEPSGAVHELAVYDLRQADEWEDVDDDDDDEEQSRARTTGTRVEQPAAGAAPGAGTERAGSDGRAALNVGSSNEGPVVEQVDGTQLSVEREKAVKRTHRFDYAICEFAVDPGQDLLVLAETRQTTRRTFKLHFHLLALSTFEPHPLAAQPVLDFPDHVSRRRPSLGFQICDDGFYVLYHNAGANVRDRVHGWQWTTGRHAVVAQGFGTWSFESMVLLTPSSFIIPAVQAHLDPASVVADELDNAIDLSFTHHLLLYAFPPLAAAGAGAPSAPPHTATHVATIDLPSFRVDLGADIPPPRIGVRTDPPPRRTFPAHPRTGPAPFVPAPESGILVLPFYCQNGHTGADPHYIMVTLKHTLARLLPSPDSPLLRLAFPRPAPVVPWAQFAPDVRLFGPNLESSGWVCFVYHHHWVNIRVTRDGDAFMQLYDFDPLRVRKERHDRRVRAARADDTWDGPETLNGVRLVTDPHTVPASAGATGTAPGPGPVPDPDALDTLLAHDTTTGARLPYLLVERRTDADVALIDGERIVAVNRADGIVLDDDGPPELEILEF